MKTYDCEVVVTVDKSGNPLHTIQRKSVTETELKVLRHIHGHDQVRKIKEAGEIDREERQELLRIARRYGDSGGMVDIREHPGLKLVYKVFQVELHEFDNWLVETIEQEEQDRQERLQASEQRFNRQQAEREAAAAAERIAKIQPVEIPTIGKPKAPQPQAG